MLAYTAQMTGDCLLGSSAFEWRYLPYSVQFGCSILGQHRDKVRSYAVECCLDKELITLTRLLNRYLSEVSSNGVTPSLV